MIDIDEVRQRLEHIEQLPDHQLPQFLCRRVGAVKNVRDVLELAQAILNGAVVSKVDRQMRQRAVRNVRAQ